MKLNKPRSILVPDDIWEYAQRRAWEMHTSTSGYVRALIQAEREQPQMFENYLRCTIANEQAAEQTQRRG